MPRACSFLSAHFFFINSASQLFSFTDFYFLLGQSHWMNPMSLMTNHTAKYINYHSYWQRKHTSVHTYSYNPEISTALYNILYHVLNFGSFLKNSVSRLLTWSPVIFLEHLIQNVQYPFHLIYFQGNSMCHQAICGPSRPDHDFNHFSSLILQSTTTYSRIWRF